MRSLVPADALVYLETNDLAAALQPIVDSKPFTEVATKKPDFSALKGVQIAVAITGFETSEEKLTDENSVGRVQPHFVAVADTHAWNYQAVAFAEKKLGGFVEQTYDSEPKLEKSDAKGGQYFTWTAPTNEPNGRKAYALVIDSIIYFSNDESAIDKCLAVRRGESDSIAKTGKVKPADPGTLASGYVSTDGVAQIANIAALKFASETSDESEVQSAVASILPQLIRGTITDVIWTQRRTDDGIEDTYQVGMPSETSNVLAETLRPSGDMSAQSESNKQLVGWLPSTMFSATRYNFKEPQVAWRSIVLTVAERLGPGEGKITAALGQALWEQYGVSDAEMFLRSLGDGDKRTKNIVTVKLGENDDQTILIANSGDTQLTRNSLLKEFKQSWQGEDGYNGWKTTDGDLQVFFSEGLLKLGPTDEFKNLSQRPGEPAELPARLLKTSAPIATVGQDTSSGLKLIETLASEGPVDSKVACTYVTETRFNKTGMERKTTSDFGLIGSIIAMLADE